MKHLNRFNESIEEEIINDFEKAYTKGSCSFNLDYYGSKWDKKRGEFHLYDDYYLYKDAIFQLNTRPSGDWYHTELVKLKEPAHVFKEKIFKKIQELEVAFDKI